MYMYMYMCMYVYAYVYVYVYSHVHVYVCVFPCIDVMTHIVCVESVDRIRPKIDEEILRNDRRY